MSAESLSLSIPAVNIIDKERGKYKVEYDNGKLQGQLTFTTASSHIGQWDSVYLVLSDLIGHL